jgi:signal transduction histidine kinase
MKLVPKLSLAFIGTVSIVLAANGYLRVKREVALFDSDRVRDDVLMEEALASAVETVWKSDGRDAALSMIEKASAREGRVRMRWIWLDDPKVPTVERDSAIDEASPTTRVAMSESGDSRRYTFMRLSVPDARPGALELSESLAPERAYVRQTIESSIVTALTLDGLCALLAMVLGAWIIGRPMLALTAKARRIGEGNFGEPLHMSQRDEMADLAREMNAMCDRLVDAHDRAERETRSRIAMLEQLRHADRLVTVGKLASGVAHEIGTPLNVVEARAAMIADGTTTPAEAADYARVIVTATERIARIIRQLLAFARRETAHKTACDLTILAKRTTELLDSLAAKRNVALRIVSNDVPCVVDADAPQIEQVLTNLVMNAIQASNGGSVQIAIDSIVENPPADHGGAKATYARVRVTDEGRGIAAENLPHIFEPFFTTKDVGQGTGLGLSISYGIIREHGGWITASSNGKNGAELTFYLPRNEKT